MKSIQESVVALLAAGALSVAIAGCNEPNEPNAIGPEDFDQAGNLDPQLPADEEAEIGAYGEGMYETYESEAEAGTQPPQPAEWGDVGEERTGAFTYEE